MWPTEYMVHEHRKELQRVAAQVSLVREASSAREAQPSRRAGWLAFAANARVFNAIRRFRRPRPAVTAEAAPCPQTAVLGRVN